MGGGPIESASTYLAIHQCVTLRFTPSVTECSPEPGVKVVKGVKVPADSASVPATAVCVPAVYRTEKVEKPDETPPHPFFCNLNST